MAYNFPVADFSGLADIPKIYDEAQKEQLRKTLFQDLTSASSPKDFQNAGLRALKAGLGPEADRLFTHAETRLGIIQRGAADAALAEWMRNNRGLGGVAGAGTPAPATPSMGTVTYPSPITEAPVESAPTGAPATVPYLPPPGPRSELPPPQPPQNVAATAPLTQLAGPPPTPDTVPPSLNAPPPSSAPPLMAAPGMPARGPDLTPSPAELPPSPPGVPPMAPATGAVPVAPRRIVETPAPALEGKAVESAIVNSPLSNAPPKAANLPIVRMKLDEFRNSLRQQNLPPEIQAFHMENAQRSLDGKIPLSYGEYQQYRESGKGRDEDLRKAAEVYNTAGESGRSLMNTLRPMLDIVNNPDFVAGKQGGVFELGGSLAGASSMLEKGIKNLADGLGIPVPQGLTTPADLRDAFVSLGNRAVIQALGGNLGKGINSAERVYMAQTVPSLMNSKEGSRVLLKILDRASERAQVGGDLANHYMRNYYDTTRGSAGDLHIAVNNALDKYNAAQGSILDEVPKGWGTSLKGAIGEVVSRGAASATPETAIAGARAAIGSPSGPPGPVITGGESPALGGSAIAPRPRTPVPLPYDPTEAITGGANAPRGPLGMNLGGLANLISGRAQVPPVTSQSEEDAKRMDELRRLITVQSEERAKHRFRPIVGG